MNVRVKFWAGVAAVLAVLAFVPGLALAEEALPAEVSLAVSNGADTSDMLDGSYQTSVVLAANDSVQVTSAGTPIGSMYVRFSAIPGAWTLRYTDSTGQAHQQACGQNGFLHEYVALEGGGAASCELVFPAGAAICRFGAFGPGSAPAGVQVWQPPCEKADFLVCSTHADDEILWLGGVLATYAGGQGLPTQVIYMNNYWNGDVTGDVRREHEKLDGLWTIGVRNYPVNAPFSDSYAETLDVAQSIYDQQAFDAFVTEQVRRCKPQVVVSQDFGGEYGHGTHQMAALAVKAAVDNSADPNYCPESAQLYGTWDVPKTYYHLYAENPIVLDLRQPIANLGGMTAIEAQKTAYTMHETQQYTWFYVTDDPDDPNAAAFNCSRFGLYRSTVGPDTSNDMMEHLVPYAQQAQQAEEQLKAEQQRAAEAAAAAAAQEQAQSSIENDDRHNDGPALPLVVFVAAALVLALALVIVIIVFLLRR